MPWKTYNDGRRIKDHVTLSLTETRMRDFGLCGHLAEEGYSGGFLCARR